MLDDAIAPSEDRNFLAHGIWWAFDPQTASIHVVRGGIQRAFEDQFADYNEERILTIAGRFATLEADLYKLRSDIEKRRGDDHDFEWSEAPVSS